MVTKAHNLSIREAESEYEIKDSLGYIKRPYLVSPLSTEELSIYLVVQNLPGLCSDALGVIPNTNKRKTV